MEPSRWGGPQNPERAASSPLALSSPAAGRKEHFCGILRKEPWGSFQAGRLDHAGQGGNCSPPMRMKQANRASSHAHLLSPFSLRKIPPPRCSSTEWGLWFLELGVHLGKGGSSETRVHPLFLSRGVERRFQGSQVSAQTHFWSLVLSPNTQAKNDPHAGPGPPRHLGWSSPPSGHSFPSRVHTERPQRLSTAPGPHPRRSPGRPAVEGRPRPQDASSALASGRVGWGARGRAPRIASSPARSAASAACPEAGRDARAL